MTSEQEAAYINSQVACAFIQALGMVAENTVCALRQEYPKYREDDFERLISQSGIHHNQVIDYFRS